MIGIVQSLGKIKRIDRIAKKFESSNENLLAAWTLSYASESFLELADTSEIYDIVVFAFKSALAYEDKVVENILSLSETKGMASKIDIGAKGEYLEASASSLIKELEIHLSSLLYDLVLRPGPRGELVADRNHLDLDLDRSSGVLFYWPEKNRHKLVVQQGLRRRDGGVTFKVIIAEHRTMHPPRIIRFREIESTKPQGKGYRISSVYLIGRDSTRQLFLSRLPPRYEFETIDACEEWIFAMGERDELVKES
ncbi:MAG: hypothetical protein OK439_06760 [Thaumarchaeota archaeon]|nr:hypothetical protein [Nitrososphaerota archaeon]